MGKNLNQQADAEVEQERKQGAFGLIPLMAPKAIRSGKTY